MKRLMLCLHIISALLQALFFPLVPIKWRRCLVKIWAIYLLKILRIKVFIHGDLAYLMNHHSFLLVSNHISWLDIHVLNAIRPVTFVAKADVSSWPIFGYLAQIIGTIFIKRERLSDIKKVIQAIKKEIKSLGVVAIFPEGTSSDGQQILPFKSNLFQSAVDAKCDVLPVRLMYEERGRYTDKVAFIGYMTLIDSINNVLSSNSIDVIVDIRQPLAAHADRYDLCARAYESMIDGAIVR